MADTGDKPAGRRRTTLVIVGSAVLVGALMLGIAALGSATSRSGTPDDSGGTDPAGVLTVVGGSTGDPVGLAPELVLRNVRASASEASANITVTAANGETLSMFTSSPDGGDDLVFRGTEDLGQQAVDLGPPPYAYSVMVTLDGTTYTGTGNWPDGRVSDSDQAVELAFDPPLPG